MTDDDEWVELTGSNLPRHLDLNAEALTRCGKCGREGWGDEAIEGVEDRMTQPDGYPCGGRFVRTIMNAEPVSVSLTPDGPGRITSAEPVDECDGADR